jgi:hypothetical protein
MEVIVGFRANQNKSFGTPHFYNCMSALPFSIHVPIPGEVTGHAASWTALLSDHPAWIEQRQPIYRVQMAPEIINNRGRSFAQDMWVEYSDGRTVHHFHLYARAPASIWSPPNRPPHAIPCLPFVSQCVNLHAQSMFNDTHPEQPTSIQIISSEMCIGWDGTSQGHAIDYDGYPGEYKCDFERPYTEGMAIVNVTSENATRQGILFIELRCPNDSRTPDKKDVFKAITADDTVTQSYESVVWLDKHRMPGIVALLKAFQGGWSRHLTDRLLSLIVQ